MRNPEGAVEWDEEEGLPDDQTEDHDCGDYDEGD